MARKRAEAKVPPPPGSYHPTVDGLGNPIDPNATYLVQDSRSYVGNCMLFWRAESAGYACDLNDCGTYSGSEVLRMRETDIPWPEDFIWENTVVHANIDRIRQAAIRLRPTEVPK